MQARSGDSTGEEIMDSYYIGIAEVNVLRRIIRNNHRHFLDGFSAYLSEHPQIFQEFAKRAFQVRNAGFTRYSAKTIIEVLRWHTDLSEGPDTTFKIRAIYVADLSRLAMLRWPVLMGFFETAETPLRADWGEVTSIVDSLKAD
jgi:hypothetical protein